MASPSLRRIGRSAAKRPTRAGLYTGSPTTFTPAMLLDLRVDVLTVARCGVHKSRHERPRPRRESSCVSLRREIMNRIRDHRARTRGCFRSSVVSRLLQLVAASSPSAARFPADCVPVQGQRRPRREAITRAEGLPIEGAPQRSPIPLMIRLMQRSPDVTRPSSHPQAGRWGTA